MDFDQIVAKYPGERYQAHLGLLFSQLGLTRRKGFAPTASSEVFPGLEGYLPRKQELW